MLIDIAIQLKVGDTTYELTHMSVAESLMNEEPLTLKIINTLLQEAQGNVLTAIHAQHLRADSVAGRAATLLGINHDVPPETA